MDSTRNGLRAGPPGTGEPARHVQPDANPTEARSASTLPHDVSSIRDDLGLAYAVAREANRISAGQRDAECRCPGRAYVPHAWDLAVHRDGCPARYAWVSVADALAMLRRMPRRRLAKLLAGIR